MFNIISYHVAYIFVIENSEKLQHEAGMSDHPKDILKKLFQNIQIS